MNPLQHVVNQLNTVTTERNQLRTALVEWKHHQPRDFDGWMRPLLDLIPDDDWGITP